MTKAPFRRIEPRLLRRKDAASYVNMTSKKFAAEVRAGKAPAAFDLTGLGLKRWDRLDLDRWIDELKAAAEAADAA